MGERECEERGMVSERESVRRKVWYTRGGVQGVRCGV